MKRLLIILVLISRFLDVLLLNGVIVGSETAVAIEAPTTFPAADSNNEMRGFSAFSNGIILEDSNTTCLFNSFFPLSGKLTLNGGRLYLQRDLTLNNVVSIINNGGIFGNAKALILPRIREFSFPAQGGNKLVFLDSMAPLAADAYSIDWSFDDSYIALVTASIWGNDIHILSFDGSLLTLRDGAYLTGSGYSVRFHPITRHIAVGRSGSTDSVRIYLFTPPSTLSGILDEVVTTPAPVTAVSWRPQGDILAIGTEAGTNEIQLFNFNTGTGVITANSTVDLVPDRNVGRSSIDWDNSGNYFAVGTDVSTDEEFLLFYFDGSSVTETVAVEIGASISALDWNPTGTFIAIGLSSGSERLRIYEHNVWDGTLTERTSSRIGEANTIFGLDWSPDGNVLAVALDTNFGTELRTYLFDYETGVLTLVGSRNFGASTTDVFDVRWAHGGDKLATGDQANNLSVFAYNSSFIIDNVTLHVYSKLIIEEPMIFRGSCIIEGNNNELTLGDLGEIIVDTGGSLLLRNMTITAIKRRFFCNRSDGVPNMRCQDDTATFSFDNVRWIQDENISFTVGQVNVSGDFEIRGMGSFAYASRMPITIGSNAQLVIDRNITFSYAPPTANNDLLVMTDTSSVLFLNHGTFHSTTTGAHLMKGTLRIDRRSFISSDATVEGEGIVFGDGNDSTNDLFIEIFPGANVELTSGYLINKNVNI